jgi:8-oxo-dGTP pyrophosphatase MutT (NUDIX family)
MSPRKTISPDERAPQIRAAGGVLWRSANGQLLVAVVHRPLYRDWTFPKGKLDPGETDEEAAQREVLEETSYVCELEEELPSVHYLDHKGRTKQVRYWKMAVRSGEFTVNDEVDELVWVSLTDAAALLTYPHDVDVLDAFGNLFER